jgi:hypothetical protein
VRDALRVSIPTKLLQKDMYTKFWMTITTRCCEFQFALT